MNHLGQMLQVNTKADKKTKQIKIRRALCKTKKKKKADFSSGPASPLEPFSNLL